MKLMQLTINSFKPHKTALVIAIIFAVMSLFLLIPMTIMTSFIPAVDANGNPVNFQFPIIFVFLMPLFYFVVSYLFVIISTFLYNKISSNIGGISMSVEEEIS
jgi:ABC-type multidrug transport system fused ATPase/permease subunit